MTEVEIKKQKGDIGRVAVVGKVDGQVVAEGEYLFALRKDEGAGVPGSASGQEA